MGSVVVVRPSAYPIFGIFYPFSSHQRRHRRHHFDSAMIVLRATYMDRPAPICVINNIPVVPARGWAEVALELYYKTFLMYSLQNLHAPCASHPRACVRALCEPVAPLLSKSMTCARPRRNATPSEHFLHASHCTSHTPHFTLHTWHSTLHLISNHVSSSHLISPHLTSPQLFSSHPISSWPGLRIPLTLHLILSLLTCHLSNFFSIAFISSKN